MKSRNFRKTFRALGLEFWLPLPILGALFWVTTGWATQTVVNSTPNISGPVQADTLPETEISLKVKLISIEVNIFKERGFTTVYIDVSNPTLKELEFDFPITDIIEVEAEIARTLNITPEEIRTLVRYQINE